MATMVFSGGRHIGTADGPEEMRALAREHFGPKGNEGASAMDWDRASVELRKPLDERAVKPPPPGKVGRYVDAHHVISEANRIFGEGGWSYTITRLAQSSRIETTDRNGNPQLRIGYLATVQVRVGDVVREGAAVGSGFGKPDNEADIHESAVKEAETDAMKRGLRSFGNTFGLALYDKDTENAQIAAPPPDTSKVREAMLRDILAANSLPALQAVWKGVHPHLGSLTPDDAATVEKAKDARKAALTPPDPARQAPPPPSTGHGAHEGDAFNPERWQ